tara:strand:+ start:412 stop:1323 length:912 start_codon:yes stop_codon:yes gene_type:complete
MDIHVRTQVEFEKVIPQDWDLSISCTRSRMCVQQLLDTQDSKEHLRKHLIEYVKLTKKMFDWMTTKQTTPLITQPTFDWSIDGERIQSSCWRLEKIMPSIALTRMLEHEGMELVANESYKEAVKKFVSSVEYHDLIEKELKCWKWKTGKLNHNELQLDWHVSRLHYLNGLRDMCTLCVGIQKQVASTALFTLTERIIQNFVLSLAKWHDSEAGVYLATIDCLRHKFSSDMLWTQEKFGQSIHTLQNWCIKKTLEIEPFCELKSELEKNEFLLQERINLNNGAYFEKVEAPEPLKVPVEFLDKS